MIAAPVPKTIAPAVAPGRGVDVVGKEESGECKQEAWDHLFLRVDEAVRPLQSTSESDVSVQATSWGGSLW